MSFRESIIPVPSPKQLIRLGGDHDGSYLLPDDLVGIEACFSPGVANRKFFEDELARNYKIKSFMCDYNSDISKFDTALIDKYQTFDKRFLGNKRSDEFISLTNWVKKYSPNTQSDLMLQMDIEGNEYSNILSTSEDIIKRFRIIIVELHFLNVFKDINPNNLGITTDIINKTLDKLNLNHSCVHAHPNNFRPEFYDNESQLNIPYVIEVTFLRNDRFIGDRNKYFIPDLPNELDISNDPTKLPLHLNFNWNINKEKSTKSKLKILADIVAYKNLLEASIKEVKDKATISEGSDDEALKKAQLVLTSLNNRISLLKKSIYQ